MFDIRVHCERTVMHFKLLLHRDVVHCQSCSEERSNLGITNYSLRSPIKVGLDSIRTAIAGFEFGIGDKGTE